MSTERNLERTLSELAELMGAKHPPTLERLQSELVGMQSCLQDHRFGDPDALDRLESRILEAARILADVRARLSRAEAIIRTRPDRSREVADELSECLWNDPPKWEEEDGTP